MAFTGGIFVFELGPSDMNGMITDVLTLEGGDFTDPHPGPEQLEITHELCDAQLCESLMLAKFEDPVDQDRQSVIALSCQFLSWIVRLMNSSRSLSLIFRNFFLQMFSDDGKNLSKSVLYRS